MEIFLKYFFFVFFYWVSRHFTVCKCELLSCSFLVLLLPHQPWLFLCALDKLYDVQLYTEKTNTRKEAEQRNLFASLTKNVWMNIWMSEWIIEWMSDEQMNQWMNERINEWTTDIWMRMRSDTEFCAVLWFAWPIDRLTDHIKTTDTIACCYMLTFCSQAIVLAGALLKRKR